MKSIEKYKITLLITDFLVINFGFYLTIWFQYGSGFFAKAPVLLTMSYTVAFEIFSIVLVSLFHLNKLYKFNLINTGYDQFVTIVRAMGRAYLFIIAIAFFWKHDLITQRVTIGMSFIVIVMLLAVYRCGLLPGITHRLKQKGQFGKRIVVVGAGRRGRQIVEKFGNGNGSYFEMIGFLDDRADLHGKSIAGYKIHGPIAMASELVKQIAVDEFLVAIDNTNHERLQKIVSTCCSTGKAVHVVSDLYHVIPEKVEVESYDGVATFKIRPENSKLLYNIFQRLFDVIVSSLCLILLSPLFIVIAIAIKMTSSGAVFYKREVVGQKERRFWFLKFRTMFHNNDDSKHREFMQRFMNGELPGGRFKIQHDPRVTRVGRFLRKYSLDELPQLINVLKGEMSLIGPRPSNLEEFANYKEWYKKRLSVRPGITGLWQVTARSSEI